jgi:hypothetical protein
MKNSNKEHPGIKVKETTILAGKKKLNQIFKPWFLSFGLYPDFHYFKYIRVH